MTKRMGLAMWSSKRIYFLNFIIQQDESNYTIKHATVQLQKQDLFNTDILNSICQKLAAKNDCEAKQIVIRTMQRL